MAGKVNRLSPFNITALALGMAFLYLPIVILVIYSFNDSRLVTVWGGWSLRWYREFFNDRAMLDAAWMSLRVAAVSATIATLLGTLAAVGLVRGERFRGRSLFSGSMEHPGEGHDPARLIAGRLMKDAACNGGNATVAPCPAY